MVNAELEQGATEEDVKQVFEQTPRIKLVSAGDGYDSTGKIHEKMRDLERPRSDMPEAAVWEETIKVEDGTLYWIHMVHQESIVVPDNIDAIRAMFELTDQETSVKMTDKALDIE
ncbi:MAG: hypothetical protein BRC26_03125 [Nanohaloarchaea archaeon QH_8_44_6]|nr:MAG: hypothetical protein BRC26_03125 [Nanohaloarchaea archaeon QH_8_44_6]